MQSFFGIVFIHSLWTIVEITGFLNVVQKQDKIQRFSRYNHKRSRTSSRSSLVVFNDPIYNPSDHNHGQMRSTSTSSLYQSRKESTRILPPALEYDSGSDNDYLALNYDSQPMNDDDILNDDEYPSMEFNDDSTNIDNSDPFYFNHPNTNTKNQSRTQTQTYESTYTIQNDSTSSSNTGHIDSYRKHQIITIPEPVLADLNPSQYKAVTSPLSSITRVIAGPGAGKTRVLTSRIAYLLYKEEQQKDQIHKISQYEDDSNHFIHSSSNHILAVTFTKKAAGEMQQRLQKLCQDADVDIQKQQYIQTDSIQEEEYNNKEKAEDVVIQSYSDTTGTDESHNRPTILNKVTVGTFHSICARILRRNGEYISQLIPPTINTGGRKDGTNGSNLDGSFAIIDQSEQLRLIKECLKEKGIRLDEISGGRTGNAIKPKQILAIIGQLKETDLTRSLQTYYNQHPNQIPSKIPTIKESKIATKIAKELYSSYTAKLYSTNSLDFNDLILLTRSLLMKIPDVRQRLHRYWRHILVDEFQDTSTVQLEIVKLLTTDSLMVVGDSDQSIYSWRGANGVESMRDVVKAYGEIDDGDIQDTTTTDTDADTNKNVDFDSNPSNPKKNGRVNTVYLMENYRSTTNIVKAAQKVINADSSLKSRNHLPSALSSSSSSSSSFSNMDASGADVRKNMKPMRGEGPTPRVLACSDGKAEASWIVKQILSMTKKKNPYKDSSPLSYDESKSKLERELELERYPLTASSSIAIIYRTNAQSRVIEEACVKYNLRYAVRGAAGTFYSRAEIKDCLCFLKWLYNGRDKVAMMRCFKTPSHGIGDVALNEFLTYCEVVEDYESKRNSKDGNNSLSSYLDILISLSISSSSSEDEQNSRRMELPISPESIISKRALNRFVTFSNQMSKIQEQSKTLTVSGLLSFIIAFLDLKKHLNAISKTSSEFDDRWCNVMELGQAADRYNDNGPSMSIQSRTSSNDEIISMSALGMFLDDVALLTDVDYNNDNEINSNSNDNDNDNGNGNGNGNNNSPERAVANLMTIHASKGMEFDAVFLVGNEEGTFPTQRAINEGEGSMELEEERRLCYVAMTRARTYLFMTWRRQVQTFFGQGFQILEPNRSRFLNALMSSKNKTKKTKTKKMKTNTKTMTKQIVNDNGEHWKSKRDSMPSRSVSGGGGGAKVNYRNTTAQELSKNVRPVSVTPLNNNNIVNDWNPSLQKSKLRPPSVSSQLRKQAKQISWENWNPKPKAKMKTKSKPKPKIKDNHSYSITEPKRLSVTQTDMINQSATSNDKHAYPIGCKVKYSIHGIGTVIQSKYTSSLRVEFDTGIRVDFPSNGKGLLRY